MSHTIIHRIMPGRGQVLVDLLPQAFDGVGTIGGVDPARALLGVQVRRAVRLLHGVVVRLDNGWMTRSVAERHQDVVKLAHIVPLEGVHEEGHDGQFTSVGECPFGVEGDVVWVYLVTYDRSEWLPMGESPPKLPNPTESEKCMIIDPDASEDIDRLCVPPGVTGPE